MSFLVPLCFAIISVAGSNIGMLVQSANKDSATVICLIAMFICIICLTATVSLIYWILPQITPRTKNKETDDLIDQFIEFKNGVYDRMEEEFTDAKDEVKEL